MLSEFLFRIVLYRFLTKVTQQARGKNLIKTH